MKIHHASRITGWIIMALLLIIPIGNGLQNNFELFLAQTLILALAIIFSWTLSSSPQPILYDHIDLLIGLYLGVCFVSVVVADYRYAAILRVISIAAGVVLYLCTRIWFSENPHSGSLFPFVVGASASIAAAYSLGLVAIEGGRAHGFFEDPNSLAAFSNIGLAMVLPRSVDRGFGRRSAVFLRLTICLLLLAATVLSQSRGGLLGALLITLLALRERRSWCAYLPIGLLLLAMIFFSPVREKILHPKRIDPLALQRLNIYKMDLRMLASSPALGIGLGQFPWVAPQYNFPLDEQPVRFSKIARAAHSDLLQAFVELGFPGGIVILALLLCPLLTFLSGRLPEHALRACWALMGLGIHCLFHHLLLTTGLLLLWFVLLAALPKFIPQSGRQSIDIKPGRKRAIAMGLLLLLFIWVSAIWMPFEAARQMEKAGKILDNLPMAQASLRRALALVPIQPYYHEAMADLYSIFYMKTGNMDAFARAVDQLEEAASLNPNDWGFQRQLAFLYSTALERGQATEEFVQTYTAALHREFLLTPTSPLPLLDLARLDVRLGRVNEAERKLREAIALEPNFLMAHYELRKIFKARSDWISYDAQTLRLKDLYRRFSMQADVDQFKGILSVTDAMKREFE